MIGALRGILAEIEPAGDTSAEVTLDVQGVGYRVVVASRTAAQLPPLGSEVFFAVSTYVRESAIVLYGFSNVEERRSFELLITAHGVGPALGLAILSVLPPAALARAVAAGDLDVLVAVPGVGKKTAQRLAVELAGRLEILLPGPMPSGSPAGQLQSELREALAALGYGSDEVRAVLERLPGEGERREELLRSALRELAPAR